MVHWFIRHLIIPICALLSACSAAPDAQDNGPVILAPISLQEALQAVAAAWEKDGHPAPVLSFGGTPALARQIENGAPADIFISADEAWMDHVEQQKLIRPDTRQAMIGNQIVLIAPVQSDVTIDLSDKGVLGRALASERLAIASPETVPAGRYAKAALTGTGQWAGVADKLASTDNVRSALRLVERREVPFGVVYTTDAQASDAVRIIATFPAESYPAIQYPVALLRQSAHRDTADFLRFLLSDEALAIFEDHGFSKAPAK